MGDRYHEARCGGSFIALHVSDVAQSARQSNGAAVPREHQENGISTMTEAIAFGKMLLERAEAVGMQRSRVTNHALSRPVWGPHPELPRPSDNHVPVVEDGFCQSSKKVLYRQDVVR